MCAIGRNQDSSIGANSPASAMLGAGAIGAPAAVGRRNTLLAGAPGATGSGAGGTLLTTPAPRIGGGGSNKPNQMQR